MYIYTWILFWILRQISGTGRVHNWTLSRQISDHSKCPVILAGGLNPENVKQAINEVKSFAVDICSSARSNGYLEKDKLRAFVKNVYPDF